MLYKDLNSRDRHCELLSKKLVKSFDDLRSTEAYKKASNIEYTFKRFIPYDHFYYYPYTGRHSLANDRAKSVVSHASKFNFRKTPRESFVRKWKYLSEHISA